MNTQDVHIIFERLKKVGSFCYKAGRLNQCVKYIKAASWWAYYFNVTFEDDLLENITQKLSRWSLPSNMKYIPNADHYVFYDSFAWDNHGLTQQYIRAIIALNKQLLFITDVQKNNEGSVKIFDELLKYPMAQIVHVPKELNGILRAKYIYDNIIKFHASKVFMHLMPDAIEVLIAMHALPHAIERYQINLTDHTFWLGATALDYSLEFRPRGIRISEVGRKIDKSKLLICPYYPIIEKMPFKGFPFKRKETDVILFSGGSSYKFVDDKASFFKIMKRILKENPNAIWVHAGDNMEIIRHQIFEVMGEQYLKRIYLLGQRNDIASVFENIDIFVNSYPTTGGLMLLYAAHYSKPILAKQGRNNSEDEIISQLKPIQLSFSGDELFAEASELIKDAKYRNLRGKQIRECVIDADGFNSLFRVLIEKNENVLPFKEIEHVELPSMESRCSYETQTSECTNKMVHDLRWRTLYLSPVFIRPVYIYYKNKIKRIIKKFING